MSPSDFFRSLPELRTTRLFLRALEVGDAQAWYTWGRDPEMTRYAVQKPFQEVGEAQRVIELFERRASVGQPHPWGLFLVAGSSESSGAPGHPDAPASAGAARRLIGTCGFGAVHADYGCADMGFQVAQAEWGRGFALEAARAVLAVGFSALELHRIEANCAVENQRSARVLEKLGMSFEGVLRERMPVAGRFHDMRQYAILAAEFSAGRSGG